MYLVSFPVLHLGVQPRCMTSVNTKKTKCVGRPPIAGQPQCMRSVNTKYTKSVGRPAGQPRCMRSVNTKYTKSVGRPPLAGQPRCMTSVNTNYTKSVGCPPLGVIGHWLMACPPLWMAGQRLIAYPPLGVTGQRLMACPPLAGQPRCMTSVTTNSNKSVGCPPPWRPATVHDICQHQSLVQLALGWPTGMTLV